MKEDEFGKLQNELEINISRVLSQCQNVVFQLCIMRVYCLYTRVLRESKHAAYTGG